MIYSIDVTIRAPVQPTEVSERVQTAVTKLFPESNIDERQTEGDQRKSITKETEASEIVATTHSLDRFSELLHEQKILDTARGAFLDGREGDTFTFQLKKQAALQGVVNFAVGSPGELGEIHISVSVREPDPETYLRYLAPPTEDGTPIDEL